MNKVQFQKIRELEREGWKIPEGFGCTLCENEPVYMQRDLDLIKIMVDGSVEECSCNLC